MPRAAAEMPRKMLPPPITRQTWWPERDHVRHVGGDAQQGVAVQAVIALAHQGLAGHLQQDAFGAGSAVIMFLACGWRAAAP